jgi:hypothetical protein
MDNKEKVRQLSNEINMLLAEISTIIKEDTGSVGSCINISFVDIAGRCHTSFQCGSTPDAKNPGGYSNADADGNMSADPSTQADDIIAKMMTEAKKKGENK